MSDDLPKPEDVPLADRPPRFTKEEETRRAKVVQAMIADHPEMHPYMLRTILDFVEDNPELNKDIIEGRNTEFGKAPRPRDTQDSLNASHALRREQWEKQEEIERLISMY